MSILSALRTQSNSIDDLAKLPQAMIMQMAQKGQIREDMLAPILARKAELAQASANMRAMQQQSAKPTVMEQILSQNAMAEAPESARDMGVAQLPVREDMYAPQSMAGGGIVAFQDNPNQPVSADMPATLSEEDRRYLEENPYLQRSRALTSGISNFFNRLATPGYVGEKVIGATKRFVNETPEEQAQRFRTAQMARTGEIPMFAGKELTTKGKMVAEGRMNPNESVTDVIARERKFAKMTPAELDEIARGQGVFPEGSPALPGMPPVAVAKSGNVSTTKGESQAKKEPPKTAQDNKPPEEPLYSKYEKMLMDEREAAKGAREEAKYARMLEAGLGILGGTSQYAFENIGKGAAPALRGYGEDIRGLRAEERGRVKELLGIEGMRQEAKRAAEDQALKKEMIRIQEIAARKPSSVAELAALYRTDPELARLVQGEKKAGTLTFEDAYKLVAVDPKNLALTDAQKAQKARELMVLGAGGSPGSALPPGLPPGTVQVGTSQGKPVYKTPDGKLVTAS